ncbi:MAG: hypothetical protein Terrestrivirus1_116 [Terrestrivirus sp.]|uniref:Uncharacterized protein n=1 Tax=Terrestrivirus sp. TaxID=2487775 RepID=A0A3G4ZK77_9VIRU|nr:MAG: hypothetical protein Terrestrivirus1_116 [Terrestrivirus sp.]
MGKNVWLSLVIPPEYRNILDEINKQIKAILNERYDMMHHDMYHMTTLFFGKFRELKKLEQLMCEYNDSKYALEFDEILMFPPDKQNLLIVKFKPNIKLRTDINFMRKIMENNDPVEDFLPHITLGKLRTTKSDKNEFGKIVQNIIDDINKQNKQNTSYNFVGKGFYLCGDI